MNQRITNLGYELQPVAVACQKVTISSTAGTLEGLGSFTFDASTKVVLVTVESNPARVDPSGTAPTTLVGQPVVAGQQVMLSIAEAKAAKWIRSTGGDATAQVSQYTY